MTLKFYEIALNSSLILFALIAILILSRKYFEIWLWRRRLKLKQHALQFNQLYQGVNGFILSKQARQQKDACEYVYGEIEFESFIALLSLCRIHSDSVFYDLGSGTGKAVIAAAMVFQLKKSIGVELFSTLHDTAALQQQKLSGQGLYQSVAPKIQFINQDFLKLNYDGATLLFINATAFFDPYWQTISKHLENCLSPGTVVLTSSKALRSQQFLTLKTTSIAMNWGIVDIFMQQKI